MPIHRKHILLNIFFCISVDGNMQIIQQSAGDDSDSEYLIEGTQTYIFFITNNNYQFLIASKNLSNARHKRSSDCRNFEATANLRLLIVSEKQEPNSSRTVGGNLSGHERVDSVGKITENLEKHSRSLSQNQKRH